MKTIVCRLDLGVTRIAGYTLFDSETKEFQETTSRETEKLVRAGCVNGLVFDKNGLLVPDVEGWNLPNMKIKSGVGRYRDYDTEKSRGDTVYSVVEVHTSPEGKVYDVINNRCARVQYNEKQIRSLAEFAWVGGIRIGEDGEITVCRGVVEEKPEESADAQNEEDMTLAQLFGEEDKPPGEERKPRSKKKKHK